MDFRHLTILIVSGLFANTLSTAQDLNLAGSPRASSTTQSSAPQGFVDFASKDARLVKYGAIDPKARWTKDVITVCWMNHPEYQTERNWVREAVAGSWEAASTVRFVGWKDCDTSQIDIKISVDESGPRSTVGSLIVGNAPGMWLNFTFNTWGQSCKNTRESCIRTIAVHEFGHAAGFEHEQLAVGAPQACVDHLKADKEWEVLPSPPLSLTPYDPDSVMNYCNAIWANNGKLSDNDKLAIHILFNN